MSAESIAPNIVKRLGTALYIHNQKRDEAERAKESVDYLEEKGVLPKKEQEG